MSFDAISFFQYVGIEYRTEGHKHCRDGWVQIRCPFCFGNEGWHLGYELEKGWWNCWRCGYHRTWDVLLALTASRSLAREMLIKFKGRETPRQDRKKKVRATLNIPYGIQPLTKRARKYLESRKFDPDLLGIVWKIQSTANFGRLKYCIYVPVYLNGILVSWQCRDITGNSNIRYLGPPENESIVNNKDILYGLDQAVGRTCIIVEGVTDVWRLGPGAVATFGIKYKPAQVSLLLNRFDSFHILFDSADPQALIQADKLAADISSFGRQVKIWQTDSLLDPGDMPQDDADAFMREILGRASGY